MYKFWPSQNLPLNTVEKHFSSKIYRTSIFSSYRTKILFAANAVYFKFEIHSQVSDTRSYWLHLMVKASKINP